MRSFVLIIALLFAVTFAAAFHHGYAHTNEVTSSNQPVRRAILGSLYREKLEDDDNDDENDDDSSDFSSEPRSALRRVARARLVSAISGSGMISPISSVSRRDVRRAGVRAMIRSRAEDSDDEDSTFDCSNLTVLECFLQHPRTALFGKMVKKYERRARLTGASTSNLELLKKMIDQVGGSTPLTFFAPSNKAMWKFTKLIKKYFPVPFTPRFLAALGSYHVIPSTVSMLTNSQQQQGVWGYNKMMNVVSGVDQCLPLTTALTCPEYVNLGGMGQTLAIAKCPKTGELIVNWGVHNAKLFSARFVVKDIQCKNGVMHIVSKVLFFPQSTLNLMELTGKVSFGASIISAGLPQLFESLPSIMTLVPPSQHVDALQTAIFNSGANTNAVASSEQMQLLWKEHIITQLAYLPTLASGTDLKTAGSYSLNFRFEMDGNKKVYYIGGAKILNVALTKNGLMLFIDRILEIPSVPLVAAINSKFINDVQCADI